MFLAGQGLANRESTVLQHPNTFKFKRRIQVLKEACSLRYAQTREGNGKTGTANETNYSYTRKIITPHITPSGSPSRPAFVIYEHTAFIALD